MEENDRILQHFDISMVDFIFRKKEDTLYQHNTYDKKRIEEINSNKYVTHQELIETIENQPIQNSEIKENILKKLDSYLERQDSLVAYENEKFYKTGFCDGAKIILEILQKVKE